MSLYASFKKRALYFLSRSAHTGPAKPAARAALAMFGKKVLHIQSVAEAAVQTFPLAATASYRVHAPCRFNQSGAQKEGMFPPVSAHVLRDLAISPYSPGMVAGDTLVLPAHLIAARDRQLTDGSGMFQLDHAIAIGYRRPAIRVPSAIHIGCAGAFNWYHFMLECLPKAFLASRLDPRFADFPLIMPQEAQTIPTYADALQIAGGGRPALFLRQGEQAIAGQAVVLDEMNCGPFHLREGCWPQVSDYAFHTELLSDFIRHMQARLLDDRAHAPRPAMRRIYLVRAQGVRRDHNQAELVGIADKFGFQPVAPETLSLREQARIFAEAEFVIGASGAAWVGTIFARSLRRGISWLPPEYHQFSAYSSIAGLMGFELEFLTAASETPIRNAGDAYLASYHIDPRAFSDAVARLVS